MTFPEYTGICPEGVYQKEFEMTGLFGQVQPGDLAREMEKITEEHLGTFGMGRGELKAEGKIWVIAWTNISIVRMPKQGERVILRIWPGKMKTMMHTRRYAFYSVAGEPLACAASLFVQMDTQTRSFAEPTEKLKDMPVVVLPGEPGLPPMRLKFPDLSQQVSRTVAPEEIDLNGHLNNTHYLDWVDSLVEDDRVPKSIWVQYIKELMEGQEVTLHYDLQEGVLYVRGSIENCEAFLLAATF